ncbi:MAG: acyl-CoA thioesterase [Myxococcales bacterium]|nr:acyl-CoA thioesterase [Myxococcales bacterium]
MTELVLPQHANALGSAFGGTVMGWIDICAAITAQRHAGRVAVTASVDELAFLSPIRVGDVVCLRAHMNAAFRTSMEVEVRVDREDRQSRERTLCVDAKLTFVNLDEAGRPLAVPPLALETEAERDASAQAQLRREERLARRRVR